MQRVLTGCVGTVCPAPEVVLQQLVRPCGTGAGHQPHGGLVKKHLADVEKTPPKEMHRQRVFPLPVSAATCRRVCVRNPAWQTLLYSERYQWVLRRFYYIQTADK